MEVTITNKAEHTAGCSWKSLSMPSEYDLLSMHINSSILLKKELQVTHTIFTCLLPFDKVTFTVVNGNVSFFK